ncbi:MAG: hypothetical protein ACLUI3_15345 [Christensenellales bacterium]
MTGTKKRTNNARSVFEGRSPGSVNADDRTCEVRWYTGARVERYSWSEGRYLLELSMESKAVNLQRLKSGSAPLLNSHSAIHWKM